MDIIKNSSPSGLKEIASAITQWLKEHSHDRVSADPEVRENWWETLEWLYHNAWWHYMTFTRNFVDLKFRLGDGGWNRKRTKWGISSSERGLGSAAAPRNKQIGERSPGGDNTAVEELRQFGNTLKFGYAKGDWLRLVEMDGKYGKFLSLERGHTRAGEDDEGNVITDTKKDSWFSVNSDSDIAKAIAEMFTEAAEKLSQP